MPYEKNLLEQISKMLLKSGEKIALAESVTAGFLQNAFSQMNKSMDFFEGGMTAYTIESKVKLLNVNLEEAEKTNCVSPQIAEEMAENVSKLFQTEWSIAITGYASPVKESDFKLFAFYSINHLGKILSSKKIELPESNSPEDAQNIYVHKVLNEFKNLISEPKNLLTESKIISKN